MDAGVRLRRDWHARLKPVDEAERAAVDAIVATVVCRLHLAPVETRLLDRLAQGTCEPGMPSLSTLCRYRARLEKERLMAEQELAELKALRPREIPHPSLNPERLEWLADHLRRRRAAPPPAAASAPAAGEREAIRARDTRGAAAAPPDAPELGDSRAAPNRASSDPPDPLAAAPIEPAAAAAPDRPAEGAADPEPTGPPRPRSRASGPFVPPAPGPRVDWLSSTSSYAIAAAQLAAGRL